MQNYVKMCGPQHGPTIKSDNVWPIVKKVTIKKSFLNEFKLNGSDNAVRKSK